MIKFGSFSQLLLPKNIKLQLATLKSGLVPRVICSSMTCNDFCASRTNLCSTEAVGDFLVQWALNLSRGVDRNISGSVTLSLVKRSGISVRSSTE